MNRDGLAEKANTAMAPALRTFYIYTGSWGIRWGRLENARYRIRGEKLKVTLCEKLALSLLYNSPVTVI